MNHTDTGELAAQHDPDACEGIVTNTSKRLEAHVFRLGYEAANRVIKIKTQANADLKAALKDRTDAWLAAERTTNDLRWIAVSLTGLALLLFAALAAVLMKS